MTVTVTPLVESVAILAAETPIYTSPASTRTIIDKATLTNTTGAAITVTIKTPAAISTPPTAANTISSLVAIAANATYACPDLVGHTLGAGDIISLLPTAVGLTFRMSGRLVVG